MHPFDHTSVWSVRKVDTAATAAVLATAEPLTSPTKLPAPMTELNTDSVVTLATTLVNKFYQKRSRAEATYAEQAERVTGSD